MERPKWAAVALIERSGPSGSELLLVRRARRAGDPWSGDWALPGGIAASGDADPTATARRETAEEVGLQLTEPTGTLPRRFIFHPRHRLLPLVPVRFSAPPGASVTLDPKEIAAYAWLSRARLGWGRREWLWVRGVFPWYARVRRVPSETGGLCRIWGITGAIFDDLARMS